MKAPLILLATIGISAGLVSCGGIHFTDEGYQQALKSGLQKIPEAGQVEKLLGDSDHFISFSGSRSVGNDWNTEVFFYDRYILTMQVPVKMGYRFDEVQGVLEEPTFYLHEVESVDISPTGQVGASFHRGVTFTAAEWKRVYEADGDFSVIGIDLKKDQPVKDFKTYENATREPRVKVKRDEGDEN